MMTPIRNFSRRAAATRALNKFKVKGAAADGDAGDLEMMRAQFLFRVKTGELLMELTQLG
jgi:hypothetical protein